MIQIAARTVCGYSVGDRKRDEAKRETKNINCCGGLVPREVAQRGG